MGLILLCIAALGISAFINLNLPTHSQTTERLSDVEKARLAEAAHLRHSLGEAVWPGWGLPEIPTIVYNEEYAFLVGYPDPPDGWVRMPQNEPRGGAWEAVPNDAFEGQTYYRQPLPNPEITPENFTVLVGERWVATLQTKEYAETVFYTDFQEELPPALRPIFPYRLAWGVIMGETENYIGGLEHEAFHAFQGSMAPSRLAEAEMAAQSENLYPWDNPVLENDWSTEADLLVRAVRSESHEETIELARQFLTQRDERRTTAGLGTNLVNYERQREWLEGLAKYVEVSIGRSAATTPGYTPLPVLSIDPDFGDYASRERFWSGQIDEVKRSAVREGETRFYYGGMAQAILLDRLMPGWKEQAFNQGVMLEDLLQEALDRL